MKTFGRNFFAARKTLPAVNAALGLLLVIAVLLLVRDIISVSLPARDRTEKTADRPQTVRRYSLLDYAAILKNNPFGFPAGELKPLAAAPGVSSSQSDLSLIGTVAGKKTLSYAIFADRSGKQEVFRVGAAVFGLGRLSRVEKGRVFILTGGSEIEVPLADVATVKEIRPSSAADSFGRKTGETTYQVDMQSVQQAIDRPNQIMTDARFMPNMVEGRQQGFILKEVKPGGIYGSLGLRNGDVLLRINEFNISNPETALQALTALKGVDRAQFDIIRSGARMTMTYQIR